MQCFILYFNPRVDHLTIFYTSSFPFIWGKNLLLFFSTKYPEKSQLSKDKWRIFKISKDLKDIVEEMPEDLKKRKKCKIQENMSEDSMSEDL